MTPPFIAGEDDAPMLFSNVEDVEAYIEIYDIDAFDIYDSNGVVLKLVQDPSGYKVKLVEPLDSITDVVRLKYLLGVFLDHRLETPNFDRNNLEEMVRKALPFAYSIPKRLTIKSIFEWFAIRKKR